MLKRDKDGLYYVSDKTGRKYELDSGTCINADKECSSDICYILDSGFTEKDYYRWMNDEIERTDDNEERFVGFFYGALFLTDEKYKEEYTKVIEEIVNYYESKKKYEFTKQGVENFYNDSIDNALITIEKTGRAIDIEIKVGKMEITIPDTADNYERLGDFLRECQEDTVPIRKEDRVMEKKVGTNQNSYATKNIVENSCYPGVFQATMKVLNEECVDGWEALDFLAWLRNTADAFQNEITAENADSISKEIFFSIYSDYEDVVVEMKYSLNFQECLRKEKHVKYYRIYLTEDAKFEEIVPLQVQTMEERILNTLEAYLLVNKEVLDEAEIKDLEEQIEYMKKIFNT